MNKRDLLELLQNASWSPVDIAHKKGWQPSTVRTVLERMRTYGLVNRVKANEPGPGRQTHYYSITTQGLKRLLFYKDNPDYVSRWRKSKGK